MAGSFRAGGAYYKSDDSKRAEQQEAICGERLEKTPTLARRCGTTVGGDLTREIGTYTLDVIFEDTCYSFAMLDVFLCYDRQVANLISVVGHEIFE